MGFRTRRRPHPSGGRLRLQIQVYGRLQRRFNGTAEDSFGSWLCKTAKIQCGVEQPIVGRRHEMPHTTCQATPSCGGRLPTAGPRALKRGRIV
jgi:hypothetical protein